MHTARCWEAVYTSVSYSYLWHSILSFGKHRYDNEGAWQWTRYKSVSPHWSHWQKALTSLLYKPHQVLKACGKSLCETREKARASPPFPWPVVSAVPTLDHPPSIAAPQIAVTFDLRVSCDGYFWCLSEMCVCVVFWCRKVVWCDSLSRVTGVNSDDCNFTVAQFHVPLWPATVFLWIIFILL